MPSMVPLGLSAAIFLLWVVPLDHVWLPQMALFGVISCSLSQIIPPNANPWRVLWRDQLIKVLYLGIP